MDGLLHVGKDGMKKKPNNGNGGFSPYLHFNFIILQIPATWLIAKFSKIIKYYIMSAAISGRDRQIGSKGQLRGSVHWKTRPLDLLLMRLGANLDIHSGNTQFNGVCLAMVLVRKIMVRDLQGNNFA